MANRNSHPILAHGEMYITPVIKKPSPAAPVSPIIYEAAKSRLLDSIDSLETRIANREEVFLPEKVVCVRMEAKFEAKSYVPTSVVKNDGMELIGGRKYSYTDDNGQEQKAKLYFVKTTDNGLHELKDKLQTGSKDQVQSWRDQVTRIRSIDLLNASEKSMGFETEWEKGNVEIVLHPMGTENKEMIRTFLSLTGQNEKSVQIREYADDIVFISGTLDRQQIAAASRFNPLRAIHPIEEIRLSELRAIPGSTLPRMPDKIKQSLIKIGVFDGGVLSNSPLLRPFVTGFDAVKQPEQQESIAHGSAVCCSILYGDLAGKSDKDILPLPSVSIESFRVLPVQPTGQFTGDEENDIGLYSAIDAIETVVKEHPNIKLYNISFGPPSAIQDDSISRFSYAVDRLTYSVNEDEINPLFSVAAGNSGELDKPLNRIQAPSDSVNVLSVGAFTYDKDNKKIRSSYSCVGLGREGAKTKPDILEFGGSIDRPIILLGKDGKSLAATAGTSFSAPLALGKIGKLMARSGEITPHLGRTLMIHNSSRDPEVTVEEQGFGFAPSDVEDMLHCDDNDVTVLYTGTLSSTQVVKLPIFSPYIDKAKGNVSISWTVSAIVDPNIKDPDAYTNNCLYDVFCPNSMIYNFYKKGKKPILLNLTKPEDAIRAKELAEQGYVQASLPISHPAKKSLREKELRMNDLKWDTVIRKETTCRSTTLLAPFITLQAIGRNGYEHSKIRYSVAVTIKAKKYNGSLYDAILQTYPQLAPIEIRNINRILIET